MEEKKRFDIQRAENMSKPEEDKINKKIKELEQDKETLNEKIKNEKERKEKLEKEKLKNLEENKTLEKRLQKLKAEIDNTEDPTKKKFQ